MFDGRNIVDAIEDLLKRVQRARTDVAEHDTKGTEGEDRLSIDRTTCALVVTTVGALTAGETTVRWGPDADYAAWATLRSSSVFTQVVPVSRQLEPLAAPARTNHCDSASFLRSMLAVRAALSSAHFVVRGMSREPRWRPPPVAGSDRPFQSCHLFWLHAVHSHRARLASSTAAGPSADDATGASVGHEQDVVCLLADLQILGIPLGRCRTRPSPSSPHTESVTAHRSSDRATQRSPCRQTRVEEILERRQRL